MGGSSVSRLVTSRNKEGRNSHGRPLVARMALTVAAVIMVGLADDCY